MITDNTTLTAITFGLGFLSGIAFTVWVLWTNMKYQEKKNGGRR